MKTRLKFNFSFCILCLCVIGAVAHAGSLWREGVTDERGMFADKRAKRIGDILTIVVNENVGMTNSLRRPRPSRTAAATAGSRASPAI